MTLMCRPPQETSRACPGRNGSRAGSCRPCASRGRPNDGRLVMAPVYGDRRQECTRSDWESELNAALCRASRCNSAPLLTACGAGT